MSNQTSLQLDFSLMNRSLVMLWRQYCCTCSSPW